MSKVRVHELAKELNAETKVLMAKLKAMGAKVSNVQNTLTDQQVAELRRAFAGGGAASASAAAPAAEGGGGKPKVVIRRRVAVRDEADAAGHVPEEMASEPEAQPLASAAQVEADEHSVVEEAAAVSLGDEIKAEVKEPVAPVRTPPAPEVSAVRVAEPAVSTSATIVRAAQPVDARSEARADVEPSRISEPETAVRRTESKEGQEESVRNTAAPVPPPPPASTMTVAPKGGASIGAATSPSSASHSLAAKPQTADVASAPVTGRAGGGAASAPAPAEDNSFDARRRREMGGATIVRRATPEEVEKLENQNRSRLTGRKEDHRGTRVTGIGLLSNRISGGEGGPQQPMGGQGAFAKPGAAPGPQGNAPMPPPAEGEEWGSRRAAGSVSAKDRRAQEDAEEQARRKAIKARRSNIAFNSRALLQQVDEFSPDDDGAPAPDISNRTVYTPMAPRTRREIKRRKDLKKTMITTPRAAYRVVNMGDTITVGELARQLSVKSVDLIKKLMAQGVMATINQSIDFDTASLLAAEHQFEVKSNIETVEDIIKAGATAVGERTTRPPIVTIMGHVDHGKTSLLDAIRSANVAAGEAGGITQHIGAYSVELHGKKIAFLDTPGHEAFSAMRARGAKVTDIVILVVAADDGVMPQTIEAINHAKAANVPIIVAVNKIDKPNVNLDRVYTELTEHGVQAEEWGGDVQFIKTSALQRKGIDDLLEAILLQAEVLDLRATSEGFAEGAVIEAHLDKGRGPVATLIVQSGTLRSGDYLVAGKEYCRVRAMADHRGKLVEAAGPSEPVEIIGLSGVPMAGDKFNVVVDERTAREAAGWWMEQARKSQVAKSSASSLADLLAKVNNEEVPEVPLILKADTQGSVGAIAEAILKLSTEKVKNRIVHMAVGGVTESDLTLAAASGAVIIAFNVRAARGLDEAAEKAGVPIRYFSVIYEIVDAVKAVMVGKLPPVVNEVVLGRAEVRKPINVPKIGTVAGSAVIDGKISRNAHCRLIRNDVVIYTGKLGSLKRFKDDVKEVAQGYECGISIDGYNEIKEGDVIEAFILQETAATL